MTNRLSNLSIVVIILAFVALRPVFPFPACPMRHLLGLACPTCGTTTALRHALNGDFALALQVHCAVVPITLILVRTIVLQFPLHSSIRRMLDCRVCEFTLLGLLIVTGLIQGMAHNYSNRTKQGSDYADQAGFAHDLDRAEGKGFSLFISCESVQHGGDEPGRFVVR